MSLRIATIDDLDLVVEMALKFISLTGYDSLQDEGRIRELARNVLEADNQEKIVLLYEDIGMLAGITTPFLFGQQKLASELAWWVDPSERGKNAGKELLEAFEHWAKKVGCSLVSMVCLDDKIGKYYEKKGYRLYERTYLKEI